MDPEPTEITRRPSDEPETLIVENRAATDVRKPSDTDVQRRIVRRAMRIGLWVWPAFSLLDAYVCFVLYPDAPFLLYIAYRIGVEVLFFAVYAATFRPSSRPSVLVRLQNTAFLVAALCIALMAIHLAACAARTCMASPWSAWSRRRHPRSLAQSLQTFVPIGLVFPVVMGVTALVSPSERAEWFSAASLAVFGSNYVFVVASSVVGMVSGHAVWAAQQQVYRARPSRTFTTRRPGRPRTPAPSGTRRDPAGTPADSRDAAADAFNLPRRLPLKARTVIAAVTPRVSRQVRGDRRPWDTAWMAVRPRSLRMWLQQGSISELQFRHREVQCVLIALERHPRQSGAGGHNTCAAIERALL